MLSREVTGHPWNETEQVVRQQIQQSHAPMSVACSLLTKSYSMTSTKSAYVAAHSSANASATAR